VAIAAITMDPISVTLIPKPNNALRVSLIVFLIVLRTSTSVVLTIFLIFSTLVATLFRISCKRVALVDGFVPVNADVIFCIGTSLFKEDDVARLLCVEVANWDRRIKDHDRISIVLIPCRLLYNLCFASASLKHGTLKHAFDYINMLNSGYLDNIKVLISSFDLHI